MVTVDIAGLPICFENRFPYTETICRDYQTEKPPLYTFSATEEELKNEACYNHDYRLFPYLESAVFHRKCAELLPAFDGVFCHGAVICAGGKAFLFTAKSGVGKTTHLNLWKKVFKDEVFILNGDKPALRFTDGELYAFGTPWRGKEEYGISGAYPLGGIVFLNRGQDNVISEVPFTEVLSELAHFVYMPKDKTSALATLKISEKILSGTKLYRLFCNMEDDAARVAYHALIH